ncbi:hypothetical protein P7C70_g9365, partial [Phenoliferia sp. Uapishka_3]
MRTSLELQLSTRRRVEQREDCNALDYPLQLSHPQPFDIAEAEIDTADKEATSRTSAQMEKESEPEPARKVHFAAEPAVRSFWKSKAAATSHINSNYFSESTSQPAQAAAPPPLPEVIKDMANTGPTSASEPQPPQPVVEVTPVTRFHKLRGEIFYMQYSFEGPTMRHDGLRPASLMVVLQTSPFGDRISLLEVMSRLGPRQVDGMLPGKFEKGLCNGRVKWDELAWEEGH